MQLGSLLISLVSLLVLATVTSGAPTAKEKYAHHGFCYAGVEIKPLAPEEFLLMPWGWTPGDEQALKDIKDCGFNVAGFVAPEYVKLVQKVGLKCFVDDPNVSSIVTDSNVTDAEIQKRVAEMTARFRGNPTVYGYYVMDEPGASLFPNLERWATAIRKADPKATPYINMFPGWEQDYEQGLIGEFVKVVRPTYISYDNYSLLNNASTATPEFYRNLEVIRRVSLKNRIPFWNIILANSHFNYSEVTQGGLNLQVYATLAHGGRGISYFTYFAPARGNYRNSAVDQFLHKTPVWDMLQRVNLQIHQLGPTYLKLKSVNVFHNQDVPQGSLGMDGSKHLSELKGETSFLVGEFEGPDGTPFVLIVNKDIQKSTGCHPKFKEQGTVMMTSPYTGETFPFGGENAWLAPGMGVLLSLSK